MAVPISSSPSNATSTSKPALILVRGLIRSRFHWGRFAQLLQQRWPQHPLLQVELPGNGELWQQTSPASIADMTEALRLQLPNDHPVIVVAISMGAMVACDWAKRYPQEVVELHLINTSFANMSTPWQRMRPSALWPLLKAARHWQHDPAALEHTIWQLTVNDAANHQADIAEQLASWIQFARQHPLKSSNALRQLLAASRFRAPLHMPCRHTRLYASAMDRLVSWQCSLAISQRWCCPLVSHPTAGHDLPLQDPHWLLQQLALQSAHLSTEIDETSTAVAAGR